jgi:hypothetical protein
MLDPLIRQRLHHHLGARHLLSHRQKPSPNPPPAPSTLPLVGRAREGVAAQRRIHSTTGPTLHRPP